jgi:hypothetical protein
MRNGPIKAGDLTAEIIPALEIIRDGQPVILRGYVNGPRCPGRVKARIAAVGRRYAEATTATMTDESGRASTEFRSDPMAYREYLKDAVDACVIGLEDAEADVLAGDEDTVNAVLRYLKWLSDDSDEADADPEATGEGSTSANFSPNSQPSTDSPTSDS